jgi:hypothetical protein
VTAVCSPVQAGEIEAQGRSARVDEPAGWNRACPRAPQTHERAGPIKVFPLVLEFSGGGAVPGQSLAARESQPTEHEARDGLVDGSVVVDAAFDAQQLGEQRDIDGIRGGLREAATDTTSDRRR